MHINKAELDGQEGINLALFWAERGMRVLPVDSISKRPLIKAWQDQATSDPDTIELMWSAHPNARVGIATGDPGYDVVDFDVAGGKPGLEQYEKLLDQAIIEAGTFILVATPSGGRHCYFKGSDQRNRQNEKSIPGVDFRGQGGMVLAAGNPGYRIVVAGTIGPVSWDAIRTALAPPGTNETATPPRTYQAGAPRPSVGTGEGERGRSPKLRNPGRPFEDQVGEESPLDWYTRTHDIDQMIMDAGWKFVTESGGRRHYRRPGKDHDISGNTAQMPDGRVVFFNFSSSVDLPTDTAMSAGMLYAWWEHGGNLAAAAKTIRQTQMPDRRPTPTPAPAPIVIESTETAMVPTKLAGPPEIVRDFWQQRPEFAAIRQLARERRVAPWAAFGAVLALVSCRIGPHVVLPPIVGGVASLNLLVGLVGPSGKGKGAAWAVAEEYLGTKGEFTSEEVGTSQGIDSCFTETSPKTGTVQFNDVAFFYVPEIDTVKAHQEMSGSSLLPHLRKIWSGEALGARYAAKERRRPVRAHAYRSSVVAGIQPARSGVLLNDADGGTPQRWLWLPVHDADGIKRKDKLKAPIYMGSPPALDWDVWLPEGEKRGEKDEPIGVEQKTRWEVQVCRTAWNEIVDARETNLASKDANLDAHSLLTRLKVAALIAFWTHPLDFQVTEADWELTKPIMWVSNDTRADCMNALAEAEEAEHARRGRGRAVQDATADIHRVVIRDERLERIAEIGGRALALLMSEPGREFSPKEIREAVMDAKTRKLYEADVTAALIATPGVTEGPEISSGGRKIRKLSWHVVTSG